MTFCRFLIASSLFCLTALPAIAAEKQIVAGAGPSTVVAQLFFELLEKKDVARNYDFLVPSESSKHVGGISNSNHYLFGRIGRPLNETEKQLHKIELFLAKVPFVFAVGPKVGIRQLTLRQVEKIFLREITNWKELGGPDAAIRVIGRETSEAFFSALKNAYPAFVSSRFEQVLNKDHQVIEVLKSPDGEYAIAFGAKPNFYRRSILQVPDFSVGINIGLVYDKKNQSHPLVVAARKFARTTEWRGGLMMLGLVPADFKARQKPSVD